MFWYAIVVSVTSCYNRGNVLAILQWFQYMYVCLYKYINK